MNEPFASYQLKSAGDGYDSLSTDVVDKWEATVSRAGVQPSGVGHSAATVERETLFRHTYADATKRYWLLTWHPDRHPSSYVPRWMTDAEAAAWLTLHEFEVPE